LSGCFKVGFIVTRAQLFFHRFACFLIIYNLVVVVWGAFVRVSGSGAGCGDNWPHCGSGGEFVPTVAHAATWIEWTHRASTMVLGPILLALAIWAFVSFKKGNPVRKAALGVLLFTAIEAWIGRHLVLNKLVVDNASTQRAIWMSLHLANILSLMACLTLTAWFSRGAARVRWLQHGKLSALWTVSFVGMIVLAITGALSALGDTLYPATSLVEGIRQDFAAEATLLLKTRPLHPVTATLVSGFVAWTILQTLRERSALHIQKMGRIALALLAAQYIFGWWNLLILAPVWAQLTHLLLANLLWVSLVALGAAALAERTTGVVQNPLARDAKSAEEVREWSKPAPSVS
jgi:cytochrome c oxidase assembly protein subunit 15